ncbi:hypothetical protein J3R82DRAFT_1951 [Butyriboletus roseoflavus]|nr:hypothetical protein J3R82DRAFT_1951 [Butyriboletus roseoflavus]
MSLSVPIPDGVYQIFNVAFSNQDADLVYPGGPTGYIGGWQNNTESQRMQWQVANVVDTALAGQVSIWNTGVQTFASAALPPYPAPVSFCLACLLPY